MRQTEVTVDALYSIGAWLRDEGMIPSHALPPLTKWRSKLKDEWRQIVGEDTEPFRPRHGDDEMRRLFAHMHDEPVDPRLALAFDLGGEQRLGQILRAMRSDLDLPRAPISLSENAVGLLGVFTPSGSGRKRTSPIVLTTDQRTAVERALGGYLAEYELRYQEGLLADYPLFPSGRLKAGRAKVVSSPRGLTRAAALAKFHDLEVVAGVAHVAGRGWYGVRRVATDLAEDFEKDERVLNSISGHRDSATRRHVYQQGARSSVLRQAARTREKVRTVDPSSLEATERNEPGGDQLRTA